MEIFQKFAILTENPINFDIFFIVILSTLCTTPRMLTLYLLKMIFYKLQHGQIWSNRQFLLVFLELQ